MTFIAFALPPSCTDSSLARLCRAGHGFWHAGYRSGMMSAELVHSVMRLPQRLCACVHKLATVYTAVSPGIWQVLVAARVGFDSPPFAGGIVAAPVGQDAGWP